MHSNWKKTEKAISVLSIIIGLCTITFVIYTWESILSNYFDTGLITWDNLSFFKLFKNTHFFIFLGILGLYSGRLLFKSKRVGWTTNIAYWTSFAVGIVIIYWKGHMNGKLPIESHTHFAIILSIIILMLVLASLLLFRPFRLKYMPTNKSWLIIGLIVTVFTLDQILID